MQVILVPGVSALSVRVSQPVDEISPSTCQFTVTLLRYQPFSPSVPEIVTVISGGVATALGARRKRPTTAHRKTNRRNGRRRLSHSNVGLTVTYVTYSPYLPQHFVFEATPS